MKKDNFEKPIVAENPTDTVVVNAGEEITDNVVQKEEISAASEAQAVENSENTQENSNGFNSIENGDRA